MVGPSARINNAKLADQTSRHTCRVRYTLAPLGRRPMVDRLTVNHRAARTGIG
jgi:hypothetical protein